jgi:endonuclease/exonuclease/phosphatase family metal-dependent hydrolase
MTRLLLLIAATALLSACQSTPAPMTSAEPTAPTTLRVATYNVSLFDNAAGGVIARLQGGQDANARSVAAVIQRVRPDVLLLNEVDYDREGALVSLFQQAYLGVGQHGEPAITYPYRWFGPVNTGEPSGLDINGDGQVGGPGRLAGEDAFGFGLHPGQYAMVVLSRYPIDATQVRSFQRLRWASMPKARRPQHPDGRAFHSDAVWSQLRLSSKTHADVPVQTPLGTVHLLISHPTPPVFDGPEDRNGARNADELRLWREYLDDSGGQWLRDDNGQTGGLAADARFVIAGDLNNDPVDGDGHHEAITALLQHPRVQPHAAPRSRGGIEAAARTGGANQNHRGDAATDTGDFGPRVGNLRLDYVLPSRGLRVVDSGVFWPAADEPGHAWVTASDHRLVWLDLAVDSTP